jgi:glycosyltransferase
MTPRVSIITSVLNGADTIADTIESVIQQQYTNIEYIVVDGKSSDDTVPIIRRYGNQVDILVSEPDQGVYDAMNKGIKLATGDIIAALNSDDVYADSTVIGQMVNFMETTLVDAAYSNLVYVDRDDIGCIKRFWNPGEYKKGAFFKGWTIPHPTFFCRREIFEKFGLFNDKFQIAADFELMLRFVEKHKIKVDYLPKVIVKMRTGGKANILNGIIRGNMEIIRAFRINGFHLSPLFFIFKPITKIFQLFMRPEDTE